MLKNLIFNLVIFLNTNVSVVICKLNINQIVKALLTQYSKYKINTLMLSKCTPNYGAIIIKYINTYSDVYVNIRDCKRKTT